MGPTHCRQRQKLAPRRHEERRPSPTGTTHLKVCRQNFNKWSERQSKTSLIFLQVRELNAKTAKRIETLKTGDPEEPRPLSPPPSPKAAAKSKTRSRWRQRRGRMLSRSFICFAILVICSSSSNNNKIKAETLTRPSERSILFPLCMHFSTDEFIKNLIRRRLQRFPRIRRRHRAPRSPSTRGPIEARPTPRCQSSPG